MEHDDSDMLDDAISIDIHQKHLDHSLSSSPMSLGKEFTHAPGNVNSSMDEDSTSHLDNLGDFEMLPGPADLWQTAISVDTTATIPVDTASSPIPSNPRDSAVAQIESVFEAIADDLLAERSELAITLTAHRQLNPSDGIENSEGTDRTRFTTVKFPGKTAEEAWRFSKPRRHHAVIND
ncbi:hypothetical protein BDV97DRAFT_359668 [Delphinella strobiligena]|nr:hypothetical protein BDV97DRAFT_359668 [Delphinella strobiligena]